MMRLRRTLAALCRRISSEFSRFATHIDVGPGSWCPQDEEWALDMWTPQDHDGIIMEIVSLEGPE
jgi:hypothetical protein